MLKYYFSLDIIECIEESINMADDMLMIGLIVAVGAYVTNLLCQPFNLCFNAPAAAAPAPAAKYPTAAGYAGYAHLTVA